MKTRWTAPGEGATIEERIDLFGRTGKLTRNVGEMKPLQTLQPDTCGYCAFIHASFTEADARADGWDWADRPTKCTCAPVVRLRAIPHQHIYNAVHFKLSKRQVKRLRPETTYRWGQYHARVIAQTWDHC